LDTSDRIRKANKISSILKDFCDGELSNYTCLDLGCSQGVISAQLASLFNRLVGIDVNFIALQSAQGVKFYRSGSPYFVCGNGYHLPFSNSEFDVVVCAQVYEHIPDAVGMVEEIKRILRPGGLCFFSGPNRLAIMEEHYWLPFLSWLPHKISTIYMKLLRRGTVYDIYPLTYWQLIRMWGDYKIYDYSLKLLRSPRDYCVEERVEEFTLIKYLPNWLLKTFHPFYPNYNWIIVKPK